MKSSTLTAAGLAMLLSTSIGSNLYAQDFQWPEKAENLQVLPETVDSRQLRSIMFSFTRSLGVRCEHCHVGEPGASLAEFDFVSDDVAAKETTRDMIKMVRSINENFLGGLPTREGEGVQVTCATCHRGQAQPVMIEDVIYETVTDEGALAASRHYNELRDRFYGGFSFDFTDRPLNNLGYRLLGEGRTDDAIAIFHLNVKHNPESGNAYDSLAEAYMKAGDAERAIVFYERSLLIDPSNDNAAAMLKELRGGG